MQPKDYETLMKRYDLPSYQVINRRFEISDIDTEFILREIVRKIQDRLESFAKILEGVIQPDTTVSALHESHAFTDDDKSKIFELYGQLMVLIRHSQLILADPDEGQCAGYISQANTQWDTLQGQVSDVIKNLIGSWNNRKDIKESVGYVG